MLLDKDGWNDVGVTGDEAFWHLMWEMLDDGLEDKGVNDKDDEGATEMMEGGAKWGKDQTFHLCTPDILTGGDTVGGWSLIVLGTRLASMAESRLRESSRVDDKGPHQ